MRSRWPRTSKYGRKRRGRAKRIIHEREAEAEKSDITTQRRCKGTKKERPAGILPALETTELELLEQTPKILAVLHALVCNELSHLGPDRSKVVADGEVARGCGRGETGVEQEVEQTRPEVGLPVLQKQKGISETEIGGGNVQGTSTDAFEGCCDLVSLGVDARLRGSGDRLDVLACRHERVRTRVSKAGADDKERDRD